MSGYYQVNFAAPFQNYWLAAGFELPNYFTHYPGFLMMLFTLPFLLCGNCVYGQNRIDEWVLIWEDQFERDEPDTTK